MMASVARGSATHRTSATPLSRNVSQPPALNVELYAPHASAAAAAHEDDLAAGLPDHALDVPRDRAPPGDGLRRAALVVVGRELLARLERGGEVGAARLQPADARAQIVGAAGEERVDGLAAVAARLLEQDVDEAEPVELLEDLVEPVARERGGLREARRGGGRVFEERKIDARLRLGELALLQHREPLGHELHVARPPSSSRCATSSSSPACSR
ncbi:MAG TPA: hypothetical protein VM582_05995 [Candidatus Thermoplasmatota archaeon]|nr:hypothetical protein [Candidatus Thermoplasmatota archaeon]